MTIDFSLDLDITEDPATTAPAEGVYERNTDHTTDGTSKLIELFRYGPRTQAALASVLSQCQEIEDALWDLYTGFDPDTAVGQALDFLGALVGEPRLDRDDDEYRVAIRVRRLVNSSQGKIEQLYAIVNGIFGAFTTPPTVTIDEYFPAAIVVEVTGDFGDVTINTVHRLLDRAKAGGVALATTFSESTSSADSLVWAESDVLDNFNSWGEEPLITHQGGDWSQVL
jgi:hypothetical protein